MCIPLGGSTMTQLNANAPPPSGPNFGSGPLSIAPLPGKIGEARLTIAKRKQYIDDAVKANGG